MQFETTVEYSKQLVTSATRRFWKKSYYSKALLCIVVLVAVVVVWFGFNMRGMWILALASIAMLYFLILIGVYILYLKRGLGLLQKMQSPTGKWVFTEETVQLQSDSGEATMKWGAIKKIWRFPDVWLFFYSERNYAILPMKGISPDLRNFMLEQANNAGTELN